MAAKNASDRRLTAQIAANTRWSKETNRTAATQAARDAQWRAFEDAVDPERVLAPEERAKRAASARAAYYQRLSLKAQQARRAKKSA
jgi:hypothetical protein